ncbi:BTAD domain-containing putative transcriptional regulator [Streptomyces sp. H27-H1]|uniref:AfsR/SARP family transcriptional regulator n=1 Tax=Streptomyces sp. H27-H1 TaxID=2996461 RepID=UPI00227095B7|nr:BTAD domain-containing putative transcriptional regulator [Streptomyces sp. H27-H1]MCY0929263.1 BTAD domain-containing putative transcriptional regulator [Streptomyces sp. H27-H1]
MSNLLGSDVRFNILGPLEGWAGEARIRLSGQIHERVLVTLLLEPGGVVPVVRLVEAVWDEEPPVTASHQVRKAVADLRRRIPDGGRLIITDGPGYRAEVGASQLDLHEFLAHIQEARQSAAAGRTREAADSLRAALAVWRGPVLSGAGGSVVQSAAAVLEERRLAAAEQLAEMRLALGEAGEVIGDLRTLIAQHPLRETLRGQLMLALYRSGRQADALAEYGQVRELLVEELGIDPSVQLTKMYESILRASPELTGPDAVSVRFAHAEVQPGAQAADAEGEVDADGTGRVTGAARDRGASAPCTLPPGLSDFTGRERELAAVIEACRREAGDGQRVVAIDGMGGAGKTSLAVRAAHQLADQYPDGQLHVDLRGFTPGEEPIGPCTTISGLLRVLGVPADSIPDDEQGRIGLWRATLTGRRLLLLLDNAFDAGQVLPLLPSSSESLMLVTSRGRLLDLDGAQWISLGVMPPEESRAMLTEVLGDDRASKEPEAAAELAELCGHLPLALRLAVARLRNRPRWTVRYLVDRLDDETRRLDELSAGERSVAATLNLSYRAMEEELQTAFCRLGLHPGVEVDVYSVAVLLETGIRDAEDMLEDLLDMHLLVQNEPGLYAFHDLVRTYALSLGDGRQGETGREAAGRLLVYYAAATEAACELLFPTRRKMDLALLRFECALPSMRHEDRTLEWFDRESAGIQTLLAQVAEEGAPEQVFVLARNASFHLNIRGRHSEFEAVCRAGLVATRSMGDYQLISRTLNNLGVARWKLGRFAEAVEAAEEALDWTLKSGDVADQEANLGLLGLVHYALGNLERSYDYIMEASKVAEGRGGNRLQHQGLEDLNTLVSVCTSLGRHEEAADSARRAIERCREIHAPDEELVSWTGLALAQCGMGEFEEAAVSLTRALSLASPSRGPENRLLAFAVAADVYDRLGDEQKAQEYEARALELITPATPPQRHSRAANFLAFTHSRHGRPEEAMRLHERALVFAENAGYRIEVAHALNGMASAAEQLERPVADEYRKQADAHFEAMGVPPHGRRVV